MTSPKPKPEPVALEPQPAKPGYNQATGEFTR